MAKRGVAVRRSAGEWAREVAAWRRSGLGAAAYTERRGLKASTLSWWAWKLAQGEAPPRAELTLVPLAVVEEEPSVDPAIGWEVLTASGHRLRSHAALTPELATALMAALVGPR